MSKWMRVSRDAADVSLLMEEAAPIHEVANQLDQAKARNRVAESDYREAERALREAGEAWRVARYRVHKLRSILTTLERLRHQSLRSRVDE